MSARNDTLSIVLASVATSIFAGAAMAEEGLSIPDPTEIKDVSKNLPDSPDPSEFLKASTTSDKRQKNARDDGLGVLLPPPPDAQIDEMPMPFRRGDERPATTKIQAGNELESRKKILQDKTFQSEGWQPRMGWNRVVPGMSTLAEIEGVFGKPDATWDTGSVTICHFAGKTIEAELDNKLGTLTRLRVSVDYPGPPLVPRTIDEATRAFGRLQFTIALPNPDGHLYERPGLTVSTAPASSKKDIRSLRFYNPEKSDK